MPISAPFAGSPWLSETESPAPALSGSVRTDVVILGAGLTGLSAALALREVGVSVAVLEAETAGFGASGRNAGHLTPTIGKDLPTLKALYGSKRGARLVALAERSVAHAESLIERHGIDCEYDAVGNVLCTVHPRHDAAIDQAAEALGARTVLLHETTGLPRCFRRGLYEPLGGVLNPARFVRGLRAAALAQGANLYEATPALRLTPGTAVVVQTPAGEVRAKYAVIATNAFRTEMRLPVPPLARVYVQLFRTAPLTERQLSAIGWTSGRGIYTTHEILESYRLTRDRRIVGGSKFIRTPYAGRRLPDCDPAVAERLEATFRKRFPELVDLPITDHWGGPIAFALDFLPLVGRSRRHGNVLYAMAYAGHGVAQASYAGWMLQDLFLEREGLGRALWARRPPPMPPEPLRWLVAQGLTRWFEGIDRRVDRELD
jgi:glycine/D-amino acid oxidase-like deaminating enzyme